LAPLDLGDRAPDAAPPVLLRDLHIAFAMPDGRPFAAVGGVSLSVARAEFVALVGPSGCGKSTILRAIAGLVAPVRGEVLVEGQPVAGPPPAVGFMFQKDTLLPWLTIAQNIAVGLELGGTPQGMRAERLAGLLSLLRLEEFGGHHPAQLSGGMRQRAALGRLLAYQPALMLMDEPFGALDALTKVAMGRELLRVWEAERRSILFVTHDIEEAVALADRVIVFSPRPARIVAEYRVDLDRPRDIARLRADAAFGGLTRAIWADLEAG
jgi:NitT/TauT family transport system ATP-binding protein